MRTMCEKGFDRLKATYSETLSNTPCVMVSVFFEVMENSYCYIGKCIRCGKKIVGSRYDFE